MRFKRLSMGLVGACLGMLMGMPATGLAQAADQPNQREGSRVVTLPPAPAGTGFQTSSALGAAAVAPTISPAVRTEHGAPGSSYDCPTGTLCTHVWDPTTSSWKTFFLYRCNKYALANWNGMGAYYNNQTGGVRSYFYDGNNRVLKSFTPDPHDHDQDWTPVWYIRNC